MDNLDRLEQYTCFSSARQNTLPTSENPNIDQAARAVDRAGNDADYQAAFDLFLGTVAATIAPDVLRAAMRRRFGPRFGETEVSYDW